MIRHFSGSLTFQHPTTFVTYQIRYKGTYSPAKMGKTVDSSDAGEYSCTLLDLDEELEEFEDAIMEEIEFIERN